MRKVYLDNYTLEEALNVYIEKIRNSINLRKIEIDTKDALGYITSQPVYAKVSSPNYNAAAMDGIAVDFNVTSDASESNPVYLNEDQYKIVDTGDVIEDKYNCVIMVENISKVDNQMMVSAPASYFENIRAIGEDITQTQMIVPSYHEIRPVDIAPIIASKNVKVNVFDKLKTLIIPTGDEIVDVSVDTLENGMIIDSNSSMIKGLCRELNLDASVNDVLKDDYDLLKSNVLEASKNYDVILINAGSSAGREDYTSQIVEELGEVVVHGIAIKPGKPAILGLINECIVIGLPGYPVSTYIVFEQVVKVLINKLLHQTNKQETVQATLSKTVYSSLKHLEFVRVKLGYINNQFVATPLARGAGISMSLAEADGIIEIAKESEGSLKGSEVNVKLLKPLNELKNKLSIIGSHDLIIDLMEDEIAINDDKYHLSSSHVGSYSGLLALRANECLLAPIHILDEDGSYNTNIVKELFKDEAAIIKGVKRRQVLAYLKGNPKNITSIKDIVRDDIKYVNRQKGSGTAILLDHLIKENNLDKDKIVGYDFIMPTHFNVAISILDGNADCGILIKSIADEIGLDYIEVMAEEYDFACYKKDLESDKVRMFIDILKSQSFKDRLEKLDCYDTSLSGLIEEV